MPSGLRLPPRWDGSFLQRNLLWPVLLLAGVESVEISKNQDPPLRLHFVRYSITHSLLTEALFGALFAILYWWKTKDARSALICGLLMPESLDS